MAKIKVIHICDKFGVDGSSIHGVSRLLSWWFPRFDADRFEVRLVGLRESDAATEILRSMGIEITTLDKGKFDFSTVLAIKDVVKKFQADIIHMHGYGASNFGLLAKLLHPVKTVVHEHFVDPYYPAYQKPFDFALTRFADSGVAICESVKKFMVEKRSFPPDGVRVIFNGIPRESFSGVDGVKVDDERNRMGIPEGCKVVGTIGRLDEQKGNKYFIDAAKILLDRGLHIRFLMVGDGPLMNSLKEQVVRLGLNDSFVFTGYRSDIPTLQSMLDLQVFPSLWEGTTLTIFEAFNMGVPVVATHVDGLGEVVRDRENGLTVPPADEAALAAAMEEVLTDNDLARRLADGGRKSAEFYDVRRCVQELETLYTELAGQ